MADISEIILPNNAVYNIKDAYTRLQFSSNGNANRANSILYGKVDDTSTATAYTATIEGLDELVDGTTIMLHNGVVTSASGFTININDLGAKPCYSNMTNATRETTIFNIAYTMLFVYSTDLNDGNGGWWVYRGYDANTNTIGYQLRSNSSNKVASDTGYKYRLWLTSADGSKWVPINTSSSTNATTVRTLNTRPIDPFGPIVYRATNGTCNAGSGVGATGIWQQYTVTIGYSYMASGFSLSFPDSVYLRCTPQADGSAVMQDIVQALPTTKDGKIYIHLGTAYSATAMELTIEHPVYWYDGTGIRLWTGVAVPTKTSDLTNDSGFITSTDIPEGSAASTTSPKMDGTATIGTEMAFARGDHIHPTDTSRQATLVSGTNIKTINNQSILGSGDLAIQEGTEMVVLKYGISTWADFEAVYPNAVVYCRASSNSNPASGSQTRMAFMAYVNDETNPTNVEFQYYRSVSTKTASQQGDQVYVYKLDKTTGWSVTVREAKIKIATGTGLTESFASNTLTLSREDELPAVTANDNGKVLTVSSGNWAAVTPATQEITTTTASINSTSLTTTATTVATGVTTASKNVVSSVSTSSLVSVTPYTTINTTSINKVTKVDTGNINNLSVNTTSQSVVTGVTTAAQTVVTEGSTTTVKTVNSAATQVVTGVTTASQTVVTSVSTAAQTMVTDITTAAQTIVSNVTGGTAVVANGILTFTDVGTTTVSKNIVSSVSTASKNVVSSVSTASIGKTTAVSTASLVTITPYTGLTTASINGVSAVNTGDIDIPSITSDSVTVVTGVTTAAQTVATGGSTTTVKTVNTAATQVVTGVTTAAQTIVTGINTASINSTTGTTTAITVVTGIE